MFCREILELLAVELTLAASRLLPTLPPPLGAEDLGLCDALVFMISVELMGGVSSGMFSRDEAFGVALNDDDDDERVFEGVAGKK